MIDEKRLEECEKLLLQVTAELCIENLSSIVVCSVCPSGALKKSDHERTQEHLRDKMIAIAEDMEGFNMSDQQMFKFCNEHILVWSDSIKIEEIANIWKTEVLRATEQYDLEYLNAETRASFQRYKKLNLNHVIPCVLSQARELENEILHGKNRNRYKQLREAVWEKEWLDNKAG